MTLEVAYPPTQACVWMAAGVIRFWLCSRDFECDDCPLDAALRGGAAARVHLPNKPPTSPVGAAR
jgi:hypothetical protein